MRDRRSRKSNGEVATERGIKSERKRLVSNGKYYKLKGQQAAWGRRWERIWDANIPTCGGMEDFPKVHQPQARC
jgi:hypothetical protein